VLHPVLAHLAGVLEPLVFAPAFVAVVVAIARSVRQQRDETRNHPSIGGS
jgi:hypothetical protein